MELSQILHLRTKFTNLGWLTGEQIVRLSVGLVVMTLAARYLGPDRFAAYTYVFSICAICIPIARYSCDGIVLRDIAADPNHSGNIVLTAVVITGCCAILAMGLATRGFELIDGPPLVTPAMEWISLILIAVIPAEVAMAAVKAGERMAWFAIPRAVVIVLVGLATVLLVVHQASLTLFVAMRSAEALGLAIAACLAFAVLHRRARSFAFSRAYAVAFLRTGLPLTLSGFAAMLFMRADQVMLGSLGSASELGQYGVAVRVAEIANFVPMILQSTLFPAMVRNHALGDDVFGAFMQRTFDSFALAAWPAMLGTAAAGMLLMVPVFGTDYAASTWMLLILLAGSPFYFLYIALGSMMLVQGRVWPFAWMSISGALVNVLANLIAIEAAGAYGAAFVTVLTYLTVSIACAFVFKPTRRAAWQMLMSLNPVASAQRMRGHLLSGS